VAWGLLEAARLEPHSGYAEAAMANIAWALGNQRPNGWFESCCLSDHSKPLTHTIGYVLRGLIEGYRYSGDPGILRASRLTADALLGVIRSDGYLPGRLDHEWKGAVNWACLTGTVQIALCWFLLFGETGDTRYLEAGRAANRFVRRTVLLDAPPQIRGAVKGSFPIHGEYGHYEYLNWSTKFLIDSCLMELHAASAAGTRGDRQ
jgi:hypothetical protein